MAYNNPKNDGDIELLYIDFNLLERQLLNKGEFGLISVSTTISILKAHSACHKQIKNTKEKV